MTLENAVPVGTTRKDQRWELKNLLFHANTDRMSVEDRQVCRQALAWLERDEVANSSNGQRV